MVHEPLTTADLLARDAYLARVQNRNATLEHQITELHRLVAVQSNDRYTDGFSAGVNAMLREIDLTNPNTFTVVIGMCGGERVRTIVAEHLAAVYSELSQPPF